MRPYSVIFDDQAARELDDARGWLLEHRGQARLTQLDDDLGRALALLEVCPEMAALIPGSKTVRRHLLRRCRYNVYYRVLHEQEHVFVICFWHEQRPLRHL